MRMTLARETPKLRASSLIDWSAWCCLAIAALLVGCAARAAQGPTLRLCPGQAGTACTGPVGHIPFPRRQPAWSASACQQR